MTPGRHALVWNPACNPPIRIVVTTLHLLCGSIGAGKTTFAKSLERDHSAILFSHDEWMVRLYGRNPPSEHFQEYFHRVEGLIWQMAARFLALGRDVVLDHGFWTRADRDLARRKAQEIGVQARLYFLHCPEEVMRERVLTRTEESRESLYINEQAFRKLMERFEAPMEDEEYVAIKTD